MEARGAAGARCTQCQDAEAQYTCPRCNLVTCSVHCVRAHKELTGCTGIADPFRPGLRLETFTDAELQQDFRFLQRGRNLRTAAIALDLDVRPLPRPRKTRRILAGEEGSLSVVSAQLPDAGSRSTSDTNKKEDDELESATICEPELVVDSLGAVKDGDIVFDVDIAVCSSQPEQQVLALKDMLPPGLGQLVRHAQTRGVNLLIMPAQLSRRLENTTYFNRKKKMLVWRVEWMFCTASDPIGCSKRRCVVDRVNEQTVLLEVLENAVRDLQASSSTETFPVFADGMFVIRKFGCPANAPVFIELDRESTMKAALSGKTVIEYPSLIAVAPDATEHWRQSLGERLIRPLIARHIPPQKSVVEEALEESSVRENSGDQATDQAVEYGVE